LVQISSRRGTIRLPVEVSDDVETGTVFLPMHWGDLYAPDNAVNYLTISATDTLSKQPELKFCAVALEKVPNPDGVESGAALVQGCGVPALEV
jgi:assimilatory nitrate reductase catalytic subunit